MSDDDFIKLCKDGSAQQIRTELMNGANPNAKDKDGKTALMYAAASNQNPDDVSIMLKADADGNAKNKSDWTALMRAAACNKNPKVISVLLKAEADINALNDDGQTALEIALEKDNTGAIKILKKAAAQAGDPEEQYQLGLRYAAGEGVKQDNKKAVEWLRKAAEQGHKKAKEALALYE